MFCTRCGQQNPDEARYCSRCGAQLARPGGPVPPERPAETTSTISLTALESDHVDDDSDSVDSSAVDGLLPDSALLVVKRGPNAGSRFLLDKDVTTVGRHPESDIFLDDVTVSRRHAEFVRDGSGFTARDVGSLNGTYLNRERIDASTLSSGDEVQVGKFRLVFLAGPRAGTASDSGGSGAA
ncbi:MAG: zinc-ribbon and FHA domain-containing protein [Actinomycetota bacterium]|nr:zinc-ribbon and FHA domain-containing protein [Actinomycetota bacterium]